MSEIVRVLCIEDRDDGETFDRHFDADFERRREFDGDEPRRLERFGPVLTSERAARAALIRAANENVLPDIVLIDHVLSGERRKYEEHGLLLMRSIRREFAQRRLAHPACMLCTARFAPGLAQAFVACGGVQAIDGTATWPDRIDAIWQGYEWHLRGEGKWTHRPSPGHERIRIPPASIALLPYLEADVPVADIARELGVTTRIVHDRRGALVDAINAQVPPHLLPDEHEMVTNGRSTSLAKVAQDHGYIWIPLEYADLVADCVEA